MPRDRLDIREALICTMVLVAAAERGGISDREIGVMSGIVQTLPIFQQAAAADLAAASETAIALLAREDGLAEAAAMIRAALDPRLRETAYALACEVVAAGSGHDQPILRMLELVASELELDPLVVAAIQRGTRARYRRLEEVYIKWKQN